MSACICSFVINWEILLIQLQYSISSISQYNVWILIWPAMRVVFGYTNWELIFSLMNCNYRSNHGAPWRMPTLPQLFYNLIFNYSCWLFFRIWAVYDGLSPLRWESDHRPEFSIVLPDVIHSEAVVWRLAALEDLWGDPLQSGLPLSHHPHTQRGHTVLRWIRTSGQLLCSA